MVEVKIQQGGRHMQEPKTPRPMPEESGSSPEGDSAGSVEGTVLESTGLHPRVEALLNSRQGARAAFDKARQAIRAG